MVIGAGAWLRAHAGQSIVTFRVADPFLAKSAAALSSRSGATRRMVIGGNTEMHGRTQKCFQRTTLPFCLFNQAAQF
jgi:hypothetical protein